MSLPPLLEYDSVKEYKKHYERVYQRGDIRTFDGIRVYFRPQKFGHAFYENSQRRKGPKDEFSPDRAQRMDWIKATLENPDAKLYQGWNKDTKCYDEDRRVSVVYEDFVVVVELSFNQKGELIRPTGYREWIYVGAPLTPNDMNNGKAAFPEFHNVYIDPKMS